jgi:hypothetical protein
LEVANHRVHATTRERPDHRSPKEEAALMALHELNMAAGLTANDARIVTNLQQARIEQLCQVPKLDRVAIEWPGIDIRPRRMRPRMQTSWSTYWPQRIRLESNASAHKQDRIKQYFNRAVIGPRLLVIDEIGYLPFGREEANPFFNVVAKRYERASIIATSNLPLGQWSSTFTDDQTLTAALLDRLLHRAHIVQIARESGRLKNKRIAGQVKTKA